MTIHEPTRPEIRATQAAFHRGWHWLLLLAVVVVGPGWATRATAQNGSLDTEMVQEFGAAIWIPADAGLFTASYRLGERWELIANSHAFQKLVALPFVQMGLSQITRHPNFAALKQARQDNPLVRRAWNVLQDAAGQEVFLYMDRRGPECLNAMGGLYHSVYFGGMMAGLRESAGSSRGNRDEQVAHMVAEGVLAYEDELQVPAVVLGFRLSDAREGQALIDDLKPLLRQMIPLAVEEESIGECQMITVKLSADTLLDDEDLLKFESKFQEACGDADLDVVTIERLLRWISSRTMSVSLGMRGDYLLMSVGADNSHLRDLGTGESLAACAAMAPVRKVFRPRLASLSYVDARLTRAQKIDVAGLVSHLRESLAEFDSALPAGLATRAERDAHELLTEINESLPEAAPTVSASFLNRGFESFRFAALAPGSLGSRRPLTILEYSGPKPLFAHAANARPSGTTYDRVAHWARVLYGYFEDYVEPQIPADEVEEFEKFERLLLPLVEELHRITGSTLLPAIGGGQSLFVLDGGGQYTAMPGGGESFASPIRFPRPAFCFELHDAEQFVEAFTEYRAAINGLLVRLAEEDARVESFQIPAPESREVAGGTRYSYALPAANDPAPLLAGDFDPHVVVTPKHAALALSPAQSQAMLAADGIYPTETVDLTVPAARATWCDVAWLVQLVFEDIDCVLAEMMARKQIPVYQAGMARMHLSQLGESLSALVSYRSRTYQQDSGQVTHSWLQIEDIEQ